MISTVKPIMPPTVTSVRVPRPLTPLEVFCLGLEKANRKPVRVRFEDLVTTKPPCKKGSKKGKSQSVNNGWKA